MTKAFAVLFLVFYAAGVAGLLIFWLVKIIRGARIVLQRPLTVDEELRERMLPTGFYVICGRQRVGKGSLGTAVMDTDCTYHCQERLQLAQAEIDRLNSIKQAEPYDLHLPDFPYRSKNKMLLGADYRPTYHIDVNQFALPDGQKNVQYIPPYTMIHCEEIDAYMNCRSWDKAAVEKANVIDAIKWCGHNRLTFIGDAQVFARLDAAVRALATDQWYVLSRRDFYEDEDGRPLPWWRLLFRKKPQHRVIRTEWTFLWIKNQMKVQAAELRTLGEVIDTAEYVRKCKFVYYGNIYERYNSESGRAYWLKGIIDYYVEEHPDDTPTRRAVDDYCERNARRAENGEKGEQ